MATPETVDRRGTDCDKRFPTDVNTRKVFSRPASYTTITHLVLAMAALRLDNRKTDEMVENEYEVLHLSSAAVGLQHAVAVDDEYVLVESRCE